MHAPTHHITHPIKKSPIHFMPAAQGIAFEPPACTHCTSIRICIDLNNTLCELLKVLLAARAMRRHASGSPPPVSDHRQAHYGWLAGCEQPPQSGAGQAAAAQNGHSTQPAPLKRRKVEKNPVKAAQKQIAADIQIAAKEGDAGAALCAYDRAQREGKKMALF